MMMLRATPTFLGRHTRAKSVRSEAGCKPTDTVIFTVLPVRSSVHKACTARGLKIAI